MLRSRRCGGWSGTSPSSSRRQAVVSVIGRDLRGLSILSRGLRAIADAGFEAIGASQGPRNVDVQFLIERDALEPVIKTLHSTLIEEATAPQLSRAA